MKMQNFLGLATVLAWGPFLGVTPNFAASWTTNTPMISARHLHTASRLQDGRVLVVGGLDGIFQVIATTELFDPATGMWTPAGAMTTTRSGHTATLLPDGRLLVAGGSDGSDHLASAELFNPTNQSWTLTGPMTSARRGHTATLLSNGKVLVAGGADSANAELYDPSEGSWKETGFMNVARELHTATLLPDGTVLVAGGRNPSDLANAEVYVPAAETWTNTGTLNVARWFHCALFLPSVGKVLVTGGHTTVTELYDPTNGTWSLTSPLDMDLSGHSMTLLNNGLVLVASGTFSPVGSYMDYYAWLYDPALAKWSPTAPLNTGRCIHTATLLCDGRVLVTGGAGGLESEPVLPDVETYSYLDPIVLVNANSTGAFRFRFKNTRHASFNALASTNPSAPLSSWTALGGVTEVSPGQFQFTDPQATNSPLRFYRVRAN
jgi:WD40 repeat protein